MQLSEEARKAVMELRDQSWAEAQEKLKKYETVNPNVFFAENQLKDAAQKAADEDMVREMGTYLYKELLPTITEQARHGDDLTVYDGESLTALLHMVGINMRYLGRLAVLAREGEASDDALREKGLTRRQPMPKFWLEVIETEVVARCVKHMVNEWMRGTGAGYKPGHTPSMPAELVLRVLNSLFSTALGRAKAMSVGTGNSNNSNNNGGKQGGKKSGAKKASKGGDAGSELPSLFGLTTAALLPLSTTASVTDHTAGREAFMAALDDHVTRRFSYSLESLFPATTAAGGAAPVAIADRDLSARLAKVPLLRRVCQQCGITLAVRDYDFNSVEPFKLGDITDIYPKTQVCETPETAFPELSEMMGAIKQLMARGDVRRAFQVAQEAAAWASHVHGAVHPTVIEVNVQLTAIMIDLNDWASALVLSLKVLALKVQWYGLDSYRVLQQHHQVAGIASQVGESLGRSLESGGKAAAQHARVIKAQQKRIYATAVKHLLAAKYISALISPPDAPHIMGLDLQLARTYQNTKQFSKAIALFEKLHAVESGRDNVHPERNVIALTQLSLAYEEAANGTLNVAYMRKALDLFKQAHYVSVMIANGVDTAQTDAMKTKLVTMRRKEVEMNLKKTVHDKAAEETLQKQERVSWLENEMALEGKQKGQQQQKKQKKKKGKK